MASTSNFSATALAANTHCELLASLKAKAWDELVALARHCWEEDPKIFQVVVFDITNNTNEDSRKDKLAEAVYYHDGHKLGKARRENDMTTLQLQDELITLGVVTSAEAANLGPFSLRIKLRTALYRRAHQWSDQYVSIKTILEQNTPP